MPRYYFDVDDEAGFRDEIGVDLPNLQLARVEAARLWAGLLRDDPGAFSKDRVVRITIRSDEHPLVARLQLSASWAQLTSTDCSLDLGRSPPRQVVHKASV